jgi:hypothetical protein
MVTHHDGRLSMVTHHDGRLSMVTHHDGRLSMVTHHNRPSLGCPAARRRLGGVRARLRLRRRRSGKATEQDKARQHVPHSLRVHFNSS